VPSQRRADLKAVDAVIREAAPNLVRRLFAGPSITMIGYGEMDWRTEPDSGLWPLIG
jgi:hypothetical protein